MRGQRRLRDDDALATPPVGHVEDGVPGVRPPRAHRARRDVEHERVGAGRNDGGLTVGREGEAAAGRVVVRQAGQRHAPDRRPVRRAPQRDLPLRARERQDAATVRLVRGEVDHGVRGRKHREHLLQLDGDQAREAVLGHQGDVPPVRADRDGLRGAHVEACAAGERPDAAASGGGKMNAGDSARQKRRPARQPAARVCGPSGWGRPRPRAGKARLRRRCSTWVPPVGDPAAPAPPSEPPAPGLGDPPAPPAPPEPSPMGGVGVDTELASRPGSAVGASGRALHAHASASAIPVAADSHRNARTIERNVGMRPIPQAQPWLTRRTPGERVRAGFLGGGGGAGGRDEGDDLGGILAPRAALDAAGDVDAVGWVARIAAATLSGVRPPASRKGRRARAAISDQGASTPAPPYPSTCAS